MSAPQGRYIDHSGHPPSDSDDILDARRDIEDELLSSVEVIHRQSIGKHGVYVGAPGSLLMDWRVTDVVQSLSESRNERFKRTVPNLYSWFPFSKPTSGGRTAFLETDVGASILILISDLRDGLLDVKGGTDRCRAAAILLREAIQLAVDGNDPKDDDGCEVLYGRAGLLYGLLFLKSEITVRNYEIQDRERPADAFSAILEQICHNQNIGALVDEIVSRGKRGARIYAREARGHDPDELHAPALMWSWHGKRYLGGAHGVAGILQMLVSAPDSMLRRHWDAIGQTVQWLINVQDPSTGNWAHKASRDMLSRRGSRSHSMREEPDEMVQWCHGAPGMLILFSTLLRQRDSRTLELPDSLRAAMHESLARGGQFVYERGLLRKGVGICHGVAGSVYTLLAVSDILDAVSSPSAETQTPTRSTRSKTHHQNNVQEPEPSWILRALHLSHLATSYRRFTQRGEMRNPDRPYSLYEGLAGMCCAWAEVLRRLDEDRYGADSSPGGRLRRGMPGYDDLPE